MRSRVESTLSSRSGESAMTSPKRKKTTIRSKLKAEDREVKKHRVRIWLNDDSGKEKSKKKKKKQPKAERTEGDEKREHKDDECMLVNGQTLSEGDAVAEKGPRKEPPTEEYVPSSLWEPVPPSQLRSRVGMCFISFYMHAVVDGVTFSVGIPFSLAQASFGVSKSEAGLPLSLFLGLPLLLGPIASFLTDVFDTRKMGTIGSSLMLAAFVLCFCSIQFWQSFTLFSIGFAIILSIGASIIYIVAIAVVTYNAKKYRSFATAFATSGTSVGTVLFPLLINLMIGPNLLRSIDAINTGNLTSPDATFPKISYWLRDFEAIGYSYTQSAALEAICRFLVTVALASAVMCVVASWTKDVGWNLVDSVKYQYFEEHIAKHREEESDSDESEVCERYWGSDFMIRTEVLNPQRSTTLEESMAAVKGTLPVQRSTSYAALGPKEMKRWISELAATLKGGFGVYSRSHSQSALSDASDRRRRRSSGVATPSKKSSGSGLEDDGVAAGSSSTAARPRFLSESSCRRMNGGGGGGGGGSSSNNNDDDDVEEDIEEDDEEAETDSSEDGDSSSSDPLDENGCCEPQRRIHFFIPETTETPSRAILARLKRRAEVLNGPDDKTANGNTVGNAVTTFPSMPDLISRRVIKIRKYAAMNQCKQAAVDYSETLRARLIPDTRYCLLLISNMALYFTYDVAYAFVPEAAEEVLEMPRFWSSLLVTEMGLASGIAMIIVACNADRIKRISTLLYMFGCALFLCGTSFFLLLIRVPFAWHLMACIYGFCIAINYSLGSVVISDIVSEADFQTAYGIGQMVCGIGNIAGPYFFSIVRERTGHYDGVFAMAGAGVLFAATLCLIAGWLSKRSYEVKDLRKTHPDHPDAYEEEPSIMRFARHQYGRFRLRLRGGKTMPDEQQRMVEEGTSTTATSTAAAEQKVARFVKVPVGDVAA